MFSVKVKVDKFQVALFFSWLAFTACAFIFLTIERIAEFDPNGVLENTSRAELVNRIFANNQPLNNASTIVNFYQADCACNSVSQNHITQLEQVAKKNGYEFVNVEASDKYSVPSTPSIAIIGESSELIYFGPYGEGLGCTQTNGFATTVLENHLKGFSANLIISSAKGCYCNTGS
ncbi:DUF6436 domain-containing protein [Colwellia sp. 1_MG-2023]|uniref:DUF6436 domain-containing protein n=1 Tax=Colwellia sp. 1_MG-2023 TaxID=3062649 RepID=UPI0026E426E2|nr:DUF6436 domain-containing protein [Colwellia sp. 1_MG-2023]MDO6445428.1 DUF6436 domain-containing protein [Colwellia sp. 1_MG-2023]